VERKALAVLARARWNRPRWSRKQAADLVRN